MVFEHALAEAVILEAAFFHNTVCGGEGMEPSLGVNGVIIENHVIPLVFINISVLGGGFIKIQNNHIEKAPHVIPEHTCK